MRCARKAPCWPATCRGEGGGDEVMRNSRKAPDPSLWQCPPYPPPTHTCAVGGNGPGSTKRLQSPRASMSRAPTTRMKGSTASLAEVGPPFWKGACVCAVVWGGGTRMIQMKGSTASLVETGPPFW